MPDFEMDDELQAAEIEQLANPANPTLRRYDGRALGQQVVAQRTKEKKIRVLDRRLRDIDDRLAAHQDGTKPLAAGDIQVLRLRYEIAEGQRNRLEGKPFIAKDPNESKRKDPVVDARLQMAIQNFILSPPKPDEAQLPPVEAVAEPEPPKAMPESTLRMIDDMRERSRCSRPF